MRNSCYTLHSLYRIILHDLGLPLPSPAAPSSLQLAAFWCRFSPPLVWWIGVHDLAYSPELVPAMRTVTKGPDFCTCWLLQMLPLNATVSLLGSMVQRARSTRDPKILKNQCRVFLCRIHAPVCNKLVVCMYLLEYALTFDVSGNLDWELVAAELVAGLAAMGQLRHT